MLSWSDDGRPAAARRPAHNRDDVTLAGQDRDDVTLGRLAARPPPPHWPRVSQPHPRGLPLMGGVGHCPESDGVRGPPPPVDGGVGPLTSPGAGTRATHPGGATSV